MWRARALVLLLLFAAERAPGEEAPPLAAGVRRESALAGGQAHAYQVNLEAGDFLHAIVAPRGIDVGVRLVGDDARELLVIDLAQDQVTPETVMAVVPRTGRYELRVKAANDDVPAGHYEVRIEAVRPATPADLGRVDAMRKLEAGVRLRESMEARAWQRAVEPLEAALAGFREAGDRENEARALLETAMNARYLWRPEAPELARRALALYRGLGDRNGIAQATYLVGAIHDRLGEMPQARQALSESLALSQATGNSTLEAYTRTTMGITYGKTGEAERAIDFFQEALRIARTAHVPRVDMFALNNLGNATKNLGDYRVALDYYEEGLRLARARGDRNQGSYLVNIGNLYLTLGDYARSRAAHEEALAFARQMGNRSEEAPTLNSLGVTHYHLGDFGTALEYHEQALAIWRQHHDLRGEAASLDGAGLARHRLGNSDRAVEHLSEALRIRRAVAERQGEVDTLVHLALVERERGNPARALEHVNAAVQMADTLRGRVISPDLRASFVASAQEQYELHIDVLMHLHLEQPRAGFDARALEASEHGRARVLLESLLEARTDIRQGVDGALLEGERTCRRQLEAASGKLSGLLSRQSDPREHDAARAAVDRLSADCRGIEARIRRESPGYAALTLPQRMSAAEIQGQLDADTLLLEFALGENRSWLWTVRSTALDAFELPPRREIEAAVRQVYGLLTSRQPRDGESPAARVKRVDAADAELRRHSSALSGMLLGPAAAGLGPAWPGKRLVIVAAEVLEYLPFAALPDPSGRGQALVEAHEMVNLPSASVLAALRRENEGRRPAARRLAVLADPVFDTADPRIRPARRAPASKPAAASLVMRALRSVERGTGSRVARLSRLPFSGREAQAIAALVPESERLQATGFEASRTLATSGELGSYRLVHFATHGLFNSERPELSGLVLSLVERDGRAQDGFLRLNDIYNLRLAADVVVLSACQSALGREIRGEGLVGLARGFMYAGAPRVVASLWQVDDESTAELMTRFYRAMLERKLAAAPALRAAQIELAATKRWASPYYWAPFVLQGEWR